jgi:hypothetical protein
MTKEELIKSIQIRMGILMVLVVILAGFVYFDAFNDIRNGDSAFEITNSWIAITVMTAVFILNILISVNLERWAKFYTSKK